MAFAVIPKTAGVCVMRDASDIALILCGHYLRMGLERLHIIDDGSTDGTFEKLEQLAHRSRGRVRVERHVLNEYRQPELISAAANTLIGEGFRLILPFDSDEFWALSPTDVATMVDQREPRIIGARWSNFVQRRNRRHPTPFGFLG
ncbi:glycosyltransferase family 2 protein [Ancylobacter sp. G4_0304]|uniref:glycosyltransferase family 2 protein n=1 Tax=Ancylobacter sp. G4_0304 TaxID=3114289 RepID=UPI0039C62844